MPSLPIIWHSCFSWAVLNAVRVKRWVLGGGLWGQLFSDSCICAEIRVSGKLLCFLFVLEFFSLDWRQMFALHNSQGRQTRREITWHNYKKWFDWVYTPTVAADLSCSQWCSLHGPRLKTHRVLVSVSFRQQSAVFNWELRTESSSTSPLSENTCWWKRSLCCKFFFQFPFFCWRRLKVYRVTVRMVCFSVKLWGDFLALGSCAFFITMYI